MKRKISFLIVLAIVFILTQASTVFAADLIIDVGEVAADPGDIVTVPVRLESIPADGINNGDFWLDFDTSKLEVVSMAEPGPIVTTPSTNFDTYYDNEEGFVSFLFLDYEQKGNDLIYDDGVFANIEFRVKDDASNGLAEITLNKIGAFADYDLNRYDVDFDAGGVDISGTGDDGDTGDDDGDTGDDDGDTGDDDDGDT
ncbi:MAG: cohesin domain-containing protein, partial [Halanaerobiaceae bacterium]